MSTLGTNYAREQAVCGGEHFVQSRKVTIITLALTTASQKLDALLDTALLTALPGAFKKDRVMALRFKSHLSDGTTARDLLRFSMDNGTLGIFAAYPAGIDATIPAVEAHYDLWVRAGSAQSVVVEVYYV